MIKKIKTLGFQQRNKKNFKNFFLLDPKKNKVKKKIIIKKLKQEFVVQMENNNKFSYLVMKEFQKKIYNYNKLLK